MLSFDPFIHPKAKIPIPMALPIPIQVTGLHRTAFQGLLCMGSAFVSLLLLTTQLPQHSRRCHVKQIAFQSTSIHSISFHNKTSHTSQTFNCQICTKRLQDDKVSLIITLLDLCHLMHHRDNLSLLQCNAFGNNYL